MKEKFTWNAANQWTSGETAGTFANRLVIFRVAEGAVTAWIWIHARINASVVAAHSIVRTIGVGVAFGGCAGVPWN